MNNKIQKISEKDDFDSDDDYDYTDEEKEKVEEASRVAVHVSSVQL